MTDRKCPAAIEGQFLLKPLSRAAARFGEKLRSRPAKMRVPFGSLFVSSFVAGCDWIGTGLTVDCSWAVTASCLHGRRTKRVVGQADQLRKQANDVRI